MALVESINIALGTKMPGFELKDPNGKSAKGSDLYGSTGLLVAFTCNHCPYALAIWPRLIQLAARAKQLGVGTVGINPNIHPDYPEDAPGVMTEKIQEWGIGFPYLVDDTQETARAFQAQCTPDLYLFNAEQALVYHGRMDDNWKEPKRVKQEDLKLAIEALAAGKTISKKQTSSMGCSIKWTS
jgi:peroxiredoxin